MQLGQLQEIEPKLNQLGYQIIAVSPDRPEVLKNSMKKHNFTYLLLSDSRKEAARAFGIAFRVDQKSLKMYEQYGIDIETASGEGDLILPVPAVFVIGLDGVIKFEYVNPNYEVRLDPDILMAAARSAVKN
ncbi:MAG: redoxin domain-containing protein [Nitrospirae bacterium]|nr:redoxin domain-containing protein [Nitrospirota bacterium]